MSTNPTFYISIASSVAFMISEILPFINDTKVNGILHTIKIFLDSCKKNQASVVDGKTINDLDTKEIDSFIVDIKNEVNDIKIDIDNIKTYMKIGTITDTNGTTNGTTTDATNGTTTDATDATNGTTTDDTNGTTDVIINIKSDVNDIKNDVNDIKANINIIKNMFEHAEIV